MAGLNIEGIRNLNKINIYAVKNKNYDTNGKVKNQPSSHIFSAYLTSALGKFGADIGVGSITQEIGEALKGLGFVGDIMNSGIGKAAAAVGHSKYAHLLGAGFDASNAIGINYNFNHYFKSVSDFKHTFSCELVVKDDFIEDVIQPLWNLLSYVLPDESKELEGTSQFQMIAGGVTEYYNKAKTAVNGKNVENPFIDQEWLDKAWQYIETLGGEIGDMAGGCSIIYKPRQLQGGMSHTRITIGDYIEIDNVIINSVNFSIPYLLYEGGLFDNVKVDIGVTGNRKMTLKTYDWIGRMAQASVSVNDLEKMESIQPTLNQQFNPNNMNLKR